MVLKEKTLLADVSSTAIVAVSDLARAREFYGETLGLEPIDAPEQEVLAFRTGETTLLVYVSEFAGSNKANAVVWSSPAQFDAIVDQLREAGVAFEEYPDLGMEFDRGVHSSGEFKGAWFKDPDGNILHLTNI